ncbi:glycosyltransferase [Prevotella sp. CAG:1124]|nr:glycosyltransferase [Prevotella sp. CAG:1124]
MKIVVTGTRGIPNIMGGVETHCEELFPRIAKRGFDVTVIRRTDYVKDDLKEWNGVKLVNIDSPKKKSFEAIIHTFRAINEAKRLKADIIHIHAIGPALLVPYAKMLGMKVVFTHHGPDYDRDKWGFAAKTMLKLGERMGCMFADEVIVISDVIRNLIKRKYNRTSHVHLIYNGVSQPEICDYPEYFNELGIEKGKYILGMCRFVPEKNLHHLVEAFTKVKSRNEVEDIKLVLAGDTDFEDDYSRSLREMARKNGVVLTGFIKGKKLHSLLTNCLCYCLPSSHEGLPIALLEAMSYGVKVIVSDIPANKEVGLPESDYFPVGNVDALTEKLKTVVNQPLQHIDYDMKKYDWEKIADQVRDVYWRNRGGSRTISASLYKS